MKTIVRNFITTLRRYKVSSTINIIGLSLTFSVLYIILVQSNYELNYNRNFKDAEHIYRIEFPHLSKIGEFFPVISRPVGEPIFTNIPYIELGGAMKELSVNVTKADQEANQYINAKICMITPSIFDIFSFVAKEGNLKDLNSPNVLAVSENTAKKIGLTIGDNIRCRITNSRNSNEMPKEYTIVAIFEDFAPNCDLGKLEFVMNMGRNGLKEQSDLDEVFNFSFSHYVKIKDNADISDFGELSNKICGEVIETFGGKDMKDQLMKRTLRLNPITNIYFATDVLGCEGNKTTTYTLIGIALLVLIITLINFFNFFLALVPIRLKTVNICKIFGNSKFMLRMGFVAEAIGLVIIALVISYIIINLFSLSSLASYIPTSLSLAQNIDVALFTVAASFLIAITSSIYPAHYITSFPAALSIKGGFASSKSGRNLRNVLIGIQFSISIALIIGSIFLKMQHSYMRNFNTGFNKEQLLIMKVNTGNIDNETFVKTMTNEIRKNPQVKDVAWASEDFTTPPSQIAMKSLNGNIIKYYSVNISENLLDMMGIELIEGRNFMESDKQKAEEVQIINSTTQKSFGIKSGDIFDGGESEIIAVCKDFNFTPLNQAISSLALSVGGEMKYMFVRAQPNADLKSTMDYITKCAQSIAKSEFDDDFTTRPFSEIQGSQYIKEQRLTRLITLFTLMSVCIALMGVFGLVMIETQHRRKEIGIRRVLGATIEEILAMLNSKFIGIVLICFIIATPTIYYIMNLWLSSYAYRIRLSWWVFALTFMMVMLIVVGTVTIRSWKAATEDPAKSIKSE